MISINIWSVIVDTVIALIIGMVWYSPALFSKQWTRLLGMSEADMAAAKAAGMGGMWKSMVGQLVLSFITFLVLAFAMSAMGVSGAGNGALLGLLAWVGFVFPQCMTGMLWKKQPFALIAIESGSVLVTLVIGGAVIGAW